MYKYSEMYKHPKQSTALISIDRCDGYAARKVRRGELRLLRARRVLRTLLELHNHRRDSCIITRHTRPFFSLPSRSPRSRTRVTRRSAVESTEIKRQIRWIAIRWIGPSPTISRHRRHRYYDRHRGARQRGIPSGASRRRRRAVRISSARIERERLLGT